MKNRRVKRPAREEWGKRAPAVVDRAATEARPAPHSSPQASSSNPLQRPSLQAVPGQASVYKISKEVQDIAREEWMRFAEVIADRLENTAETPPPRAETAPMNPKPGRGEWIHWAQVVVDRLTTCTRIYAKPPYEDAFMPKEQRAAKKAKTLDLLYRIHTITDEAETPTDSLTDLEHHDERVIAGLAILLAETRDLLPEISADMQILLKSPWIDNCNGRLASELFKGPLGHEPEGIGSGHEKNGRLPASLAELIRQEREGEGRHLREALAGPHAHAPRWQDEAYRRWLGHNTKSLRTAGRVE